MAEERQLPQQKLVKPTLVGDSELPVHYVNIVNVRGAVEEFFVTLGIAVPPEITDIKDLESIDTVKAQALFRFVMSRQVMKDVIELMQHIYDQQTLQIEMMHSVQEKGGENDG
jgi:hypothetical protein